MRRILIGVGVALSLMLSSAAPAQAVSLDVFSKKTHVQDVTVKGWTNSYQYVYVVTNVRSGIHPEPATGQVTISCAGGFQNRWRIYDRDGTGTWRLLIRRSSEQGRCYETVHAWTDDGVRITAGIAVLHG